MTERFDTQMLLPTAERPVWLRIGTMIDGVSPRRVRDVTIVYDADAIRFVGPGNVLPPADMLAPGQDRPSIILPHHTILPGLIDAHTHCYLDGDEIDPAKRKARHALPADTLLNDALARLAELPRHGIIGLRDAGDKFGVGIAARREHQKRARSGALPFIDSPGAAINHQGRYGGFMAEPAESFSSPAACVVSRIEAGASRIKLIVTGAIDFKKGRVTEPPQMMSVEVREFVTAARRHGLQTFAHASGSDGIQRAIDGGVDTIEHGYFVTDEQLAMMRDRNIAWVPTMAPLQMQVVHANRLGWDPTVVSTIERILERQMTSAAMAQRIGVTVLAGSDAGSYGVGLAAGLFEEMRLLQSAGLPAIDAVNAATGRSALRLEFAEQFGMIKAGYQSRFILTAENILTDSTLIRNEKIVVMGGNVL